MSTSSRGTTLALVNFALSHIELMQFVTSVHRLAGTVDVVLRALDRQIRELVGDEKAAEFTRKHGLSRSASAGEVPFAHQQLMLQMEFGRAVDNFLAYFSELLAIIYKTKPEALRSGDATVRIDFVLRHHEMADLISAIAERRVEQLSRESLKDLASAVSKTLGFELFTKPDGLERATRINALRNLIVHKRAAVDRAFLERVPNAPFKLGETFQLDPTEVLEDLKFLGESVIDIDQRAIAKFGLPIATLAEDGRFVSSSS